MLVLDAGNALFRAVVSPSEDDKKRARFVLTVMGELGTKVMGVSLKDLVAGPQFLTEAAQKAGVQLLSTNIEVGGKPAFARSVVLDVGGAKVAILAASGQGRIQGIDDLVALTPMVPLQAELKRLPPHDLTVLLAAGGYEEALSFADQLSGAVDVVIQSGEFRGTIPPQRVKDTYVLASGQRGQALGKLQLSLGGGKGAFFDLSEAEREKELLANLDTQLKSLDERIKLAAAGQPKKDLENLRGEMRKRRDEQAKKTKLASGPRTLKLDWLLLGQTIVDEEALKKRVLEIEPTYSGLH